MNNILEEVKENYDEMMKIVNAQTFRVKDAHRFLKRYENIWRSMEDLIKSRDNWKEKYNKLKQKEVKNGRNK